MPDFEKQLSAFAQQTVLCVGDVVLDEFVYGDVSRLSAEAPTPVLVVRRSEQMIGGAGNVARNVAALGARCIYVGVIGDDEAGRALRAAVHGFVELEARNALARATSDRNGGDQSWEFLLLLLVKGIESACEGVGALSRPA